MIPASRPMRSIWKTTDRGSVPSSRPKCRVRACEERLENQRADQTDSCLNLFPEGRKNACIFLPPVLYYRSRLKSRGVPNLRTIKSRKLPRIHPGPIHGALAQLVARDIRIVEVRGSTPLCSTALEVLIFKASSFFIASGFPNHLHFRLQKECSKPCSVRD